MHHHFCYKRIQKHRKRNSKNINSHMAFQCFFTCLLKTSVVDIFHSCEIQDEQSKIYQIRKKSFMKFGYFKFEINIKRSGYLYNAHKPNYYIKQKFPFFYFLFD